MIAVTAICALPWWPVPGSSATPCSGGTGTTRAARLSRVLLIDLDDIEPDPEPHPALVAVQKVSASDVIMAAARTGFLPGEPYLTVAAPAR